MSYRFQKLRRGRWFLLLATSASLAGPAYAAVVFHNDFDDDAVGVYSVANLSADWNAPSWNNGVTEGRVAVVDGVQAFAGRSLAVSYPEGGVSSANSGAQWKLHLGAPYEELFFSYRVRFDTGFDFVRGGKLPGLIGGVGNTGSKKPDGTDGWSARMMWRTNGSGGSTTTGSTANIVQYVYHPDQPSNFGEDFRWDDGPGGIWSTFESDRWYHIQHRIVMNTPGVNDGIAQGWLDGVLVLDEQSIRYRDVVSLGVDQLYFSTFFGGSSSEWAPSKEETIFFDDFTVATTFVQEPASPLPSLGPLGMATLFGLLGFAGYWKLTRQGVEKRVGVRR